MAFATEERYLGVAFRNLKGKTVHPIVSAVWGHCEITMRYLGGLDRECLPLYLPPVDAPPKQEASYHGSPWVPQLPSLRPRQGKENHHLLIDWEGDDDEVKVRDPLDDLFGPPLDPAYPSINFKYLWPAVFEDE